MYQAEIQGLINPEACRPVPDWLGQTTRDRTEHRKKWQPARRLLKEGVAKGAASLLPRSAYSGYSGSAIRSDTSSLHLLQDVAAPSPP